MSYTQFRNNYLAEAENRLAAVNVSTATTNELLAAGALYKMAAAVAEADLLGPSAPRLLESMSGTELNTWLQDLANRDAFERILSSGEAMRAVAASSTAMTAVLASSSALAAVVASSTAMTAVLANSSARSAVVASSTAMTAVAASSTAMTAVLANSSAWSAVVASSTAMTAVAASSTAMDAVGASSVARSVIGTSGMAYTTIAASDMAIGKLVAGLAGLTPSSYANMTAVAASSTAMTSVASSPAAMTAVAASSTAMTAVAASQTALAAIRQITSAINAINASSQALDILYTAATKFTYAGGSWSANPATLVTGNFLVVRVRQINNSYGWADGANSGQYLRIGGSGWIAANGLTTGNLVNGTALPHVYDNALRPVNNTSIQYYLYNSYEIAYLAA